MIKNLKVVIRGNLPGVRTVVSGHKGMGVHLSNGKSEVVESLANSQEDPFEAISSGDAAAKFELYNKLYATRGQPDSQEGSYKEGGEEAGG